MSCSGDWNVPFLGDWSLSFSEIEICHFRDITILQFSGDWNWSFWEIKLAVFERLKCFFFGGLNMTFSGNWNVTFSGNEEIELSSFWKTESFIFFAKWIKAHPMLTGFVMRYNQPASYWTSYLWKLSPKILQIGLRNTSRWIKILIV